MTDTMQGINVTPEALESKYAEIVAVDEQLAAASGSTTLGKRAIATSLAAEYADLSGSLSAQVVERVQSANEHGFEALVGVFTAVVSALNEAVGKQVDEYLSKKAEETKADAPTASEAEVDALMKQARELRQQFDALKSILEMFNLDISHVPTPKRLSGARGKRGPRTLSSFDYSVNGQPRSKTQNSLSSIANTVCSDLGWKTKDLRTFLVEQGIDIQNPPDEWSVTLPDPNGKVISAVKSTEVEQFEKSDDDDDEETEDDE